MLHNTDEFLYSAMCKYSPFTLGGEPFGFGTSGHDLGPLYKRRTVYHNCLFRSIAGTVIPESTPDLNPTQRYAVMGSPPNEGQRRLHTPCTTGPPTIIVLHITVGQLSFRL